MGLAGKTDFHFIKINGGESGFTAEQVFLMTSDFNSTPAFFWPLTQIEEEWLQSECWGLVVRGKLCAVSFLRVQPDLVDLTMIAVSRADQGKGYGKALLFYIVKLFQQKEIWLEVHANNHSALGLYKALGFVEVGRRPKYYRDGGEGILMSKKVGESF